MIKRTVLAHRCFFIAVLTFLSGCAHLSRSKFIQVGDPDALLLEACNVGISVKSAKGSVWLKAVSKEASGQFPAQVFVQAPTQLQMEAQNLFGGTEALIRIDGNSIFIETPDHKKINRKGNQSWGGMPLEWASQLFLGKIPCPPVEIRNDARKSFDAEGRLVVQIPGSLKTVAQKFIYGFKLLNEKPWVEELHWEKEGATPLSVDFKFSDPEELTRSPLRWEAKSTLGSIKMHWKEREYELTR